jgi:hypothetical protein
VSGVGSDIQKGLEQGHEGPHVIGVAENARALRDGVTTYTILPPVSKVTTKVVEHWQLFQNTICDVYKSQHARSELEIGLML